MSPVRAVETDAKTFPLSAPREAPVVCPLSGTLLCTVWWICYIFPKSKAGSLYLFFLFSFLSPIPQLMKTSKGFSVTSCGISFRRFSFSCLGFQWDLGKIIKRLLETEACTLLWGWLSSRVVFPCFFFSLKRLGPEPGAFALLQINWIMGTTPSDPGISSLCSSHCPVISSCLMDSLLPRSTIYFSQNYIQGFKTVDSHQTEYVEISKCKNDVWNVYHVI